VKCHRAGMVSTLAGYMKDRLSAPKTLDDTMVRWDQAARTVLVTCFGVEEFRLLMNTNYSLDVRYNREYAARVKMSVFISSQVHGGSIAQLKYIFIDACIP